MPSARGLIALLTDFGYSDPYVGQMKGVILGINPQAIIVDISHAVEPQDVQQAAMILGDSYHFFPPGTIHVAVVDPGVGGSRRPIAVQTDDYFFVAPDNGLLTCALERQKVVAQVELSRREYHLPRVSTTFHGRDVFAPIAAHLSLGVPIEQMGPPVESLVQLSLPQPIVEENEMRLQVLRIDRFGNLITNLTRDKFEEWLAGREGQVILKVGQTEIRGIREYYSQVATGQPLALWGSCGRLEIAVREGNAAEVLALEEGGEVCLFIGGKGFRRTP